MNIISFIIMGLDKYKAIKDAYRISEFTLMCLTIFGGSIGILFGMYIFHHKTKHLKFRLLVPLILLIEIILFIYMYVNNI